MHTIAIIAVSEGGLRIGRTLQREFESMRDARVDLVSTRAAEGVLPVRTISGFVGERFRNYDAFVFIGALGICIRAVAPVIGDKEHDPAVINCDEAGRFVQPVLSGHRGGANDLALLASRMLGAQPVLTTSSDVQGLWPLDILGREHGWSVEYVPSRDNETMTGAMASMVNHEPVVLLLDVRDELTERMEKSCPDFVDVVYDYREIDFSKYQLMLAVTPALYNPPVQAVFYRPKVLCLGLGSEKGIDPEGFTASLRGELQRAGFSPLSIRSFGSVDFKVEEPAFRKLADVCGVELHGFEPRMLEQVPDVANPSEVVFRKVGVHSVAEASSALLAGESCWAVEKQKVVLPGVPVTEPRHYTFAVSVFGAAVRRAHIAIVGAGPGDPDLVTVRGRVYIERADLVLYAGSLVPEKLTHAAKPGALVRSSASMSLEEQFCLMQEVYRQGKFIVRLHTGDPSIYGAIQEQMAWFEEHDMHYEIVPGVSSFQAAAAALRSQFTIPEKVQTIILTRGNGRTPVPEKECLSELARARATMCIYLSAEHVEEVEAGLLEHYDASTPVAVCYRLTWDDEAVWRGELSELASLVRKSGKTRTVLLVVGDALGSRQNRSKLYDPAFAHGFRNASA